MRRRLKSAAIFAVGLVVAVTAALALSHAQQPLKLRMAWTVAPAQLAPIMLDPPGVAKHAGKSYVLEPLRFQGSAATLTALAANELDLAPMTFIQLGPAIQNASLTDLRIIGDEIRDGVEDYATNEYMVLKDGPIRKVEDMKGKVFATNGIGGGQDVFARVMFRKHGMVTPRDYTTVEVSFPNMRAFLAEKKADLVVGVKPFTEDPRFRDIAHTLFTQKEAVGPSDMVFLTARAVHRQEPRRARRLLRGLHPRHPLVHGPRQPAGRGRDRLEVHQRAAGTARLDLHQTRLLPRPQRCARPGRHPAERRHAQGVQLLEPAARGQELRRSEPDRRCGEASEVTRRKANIPGAFR